MNGNILRSIQMELLKTVLWKWRILHRKARTLRFIFDIPVDRIALRNSFTRWIAVTRPVEAISTTAVAIVEEPTVVLCQQHLSESTLLENTDNSLTHGRRMRCIACLARTSQSSGLNGGNNTLGSLSFSMDKGTIHVLPGTEAVALSSLLLSTNENDISVVLIKKHTRNAVDRKKFYESIRQEIKVTMTMKTTNEKKDIISSSSTKPYAVPMNKDNSKSSKLRTHSLPSAKTLQNNRLKRKKVAFDLKC